MDKKKEYMAPALEIMMVELEQGIAASSAALTKTDTDITVEDITDEDPTNTQSGEF